MKRVNFYLVVVMLISSMTVFGQKYGKSAQPDLIDLYVNIKI